VIVPSSSSSSSESTLSDYSTDTAEILRKSAKNLKTIKGNNKKKAPQKTTHNPPKEAVAKDTSILDHLISHLSGDAFTHSNLNSPNHPINKFVNATSEAPTEPPIQESPITND
jgi:hypothetical protein